MLLLIDIFSINKGRGYVNPSLEIIVTERCSTGGCPLEEACEHCFLNQSAFLLLFRISFYVYCEDYAGYFTVILPFLAFYFCSAYFIYLVSCKNNEIAMNFIWEGLPNPLRENVGKCSSAKELGDKLHDIYSSPIIDSENAKEDADTKQEERCSSCQTDS
jgi:hypothetical protein